MGKNIRNNMILVMMMVLVLTEEIFYRYLGPMTSLVLEMATNNSMISSTALLGSDVNRK